jgi:hypothetical protein
VRQIIRRIIHAGRGEWVGGKSRSGQPRSSYSREEIIHMAIEHLRLLHIGQMGCGCVFQMTVVKLSVLKRLRASKAAS